VGEARPHQVTELPAIAAHITEYRCHRRQCPACGTTTWHHCPTSSPVSLGRNSLR
jgi:hypothetical protein